MSLLERRCRFRPSPPTHGRRTPPPPIATPLDSASEPESHSKPRTPPISHKSCCAPTSPCLNLPESCVSLHRSPARRSQALTTLPRQDQIFLPGCNIPTSTPTGRIHQDS